MPNALPIQLGPTSESGPLGAGPASAGKTAGTSSSFTQALSRSSHGHADAKGTSGPHTKTSPSASGASAANPAGTPSHHAVKKAPKHHAASTPVKPANATAALGAAPILGVPVKGGKGQAAGALNHIGPAQLSRPTIPAPGRLAKDPQAALPTKVPVTHVTRQGAVSTAAMGANPAEATPLETTQPKAGGSSGHVIHGGPAMAARTLGVGRTAVQHGTSVEAPAPSAKSVGATSKAGTTAGASKTNAVMPQNSSTAESTTAPAMSPMSATAHAHTGHGVRGHAGPPAAPVKTASTPQQPAWKIQSNGVVAQDGAKRSSWTIQPPLANGPAMKLELTQSGSKLKADLTVSPQVMGLINASPTALPHHAVHLPEGVSTLEFSLFTQGGGAGFGDMQPGQQGGGSGTMPSYQSGPSVPLAAAALEYAGTLNDGIDYRA